MEVYSFKLLSDSIQTAAVLLRFEFKTINFVKIWDIDIDLEQCSAAGVPRHTGVLPQGFRCAANFYNKLFSRKL
jgi:hypothetical protein